MAYTMSARLAGHETKNAIRICIAESRWEVQVYSVRSETRSRSCDVRQHTSAFRIDAQVYVQE